MKRIAIALLCLSCGDNGTTSDASSDVASMDSSATDSSTFDSSVKDSGTDTTTGTDATMDAGTDATMDVFDSGFQVTCQSYCTGIMQVCAGNDKQYLDNATCLAMCAKLSVGDAGASMGNSLACRVYHLGVASQNAQQASAHCPHAGPYGYGQCGTECEDFCLLYDSQCGQGTFGGGGCTQACPNITNPNNLTTFLNASGNTLDCREYHLENAYQANNTNGQGHCSHATSGGGGVCQ